MEKIEKLLAVIIVLLGVGLFFTVNPIPNVKRDTLAVPADNHNQSSLPSLPTFAVLVKIGGIEKLTLVGQPKSSMQCQALAKAAKGECVVVVEEVYPDGVRIVSIDDQTTSRRIGHPNSKP